MRLYFEQDFFRFGKAQSGSIEGVFDAARRFGIAARLCEEAERGQVLRCWCYLSDYFDFASMIISKSRLLNLLSDDCFALGYEDRDSSELVYIKKSSYDQRLFLRLRLHGGRSGNSRHVDRFYANAQISLAPGRTSVKGLEVTRFVKGLPFTDLERGWSSVRDERQASEWEVAVVECGVREVETLESDAAAELLANSEAMLKFVEVCYSEFIGGACVQSLTSHLTSEEIRIVSTVEEYPVVLIPSGIMVYQLALSLIYALWIRIEGEPLVDPDPYRNKDVFLRLQVLTSRIAGEVGWP